MNKIKVIVVDDSATIRSVFSHILSSDKQIEVVATAEDAYDAREKIKRYNPDVITLDVEMPKMDGISFLEKIMTLRPMPVIMVSTLTTRGADITLKALEMGAVDYVAKPLSMEGSAMNQFCDELLRKVLHAPGARPSFRQMPAAPILTYRGNAAQSLITLGASTGGVEALRDIMLRLPANAPPVVITQHLPEVFTASFACRLDALCAMVVQEAADGDVVTPGYAYIAPGNRHMEIRQEGARLVCRLSDGPHVSGHRPSVDVMFHSIAQLRHRKIIGAILTGMGQDGANGLLAMRQAGARTLGQSAASCVVYGMPKAAMAAGAVEKEHSLADIPRELLQLCS